MVSWADTRLDVLPLFAALAKLGAIFAPLNALYGAAEADHAADSVAQLLRDSGYIEILFLPGGFAEWRSAGLPVETGEGKR